MKVWTQVESRGFNGKKKKVLALLDDADDDLVENPASEMEPDPSAMTSLPHILQRDNARTVVFFYTQVLNNSCSITFDATSSASQRKINFSIFYSSLRYEDMDFWQTVQVSSGRTSRMAAKNSESNSQKTSSNKNLQDQIQGKDFRVSVNCEENLTTEILVTE